ncbi:MAG: hypothetical protein D6814_09355, partial [Calditrichaeota bacterium]
MLAQTASDQQAPLKVDYQDRLRFYLDQKSKGFLKEMVAKEKLLLQMIQNISSEIRSRGVKGILADEPGFKHLYGDIDQLVDEYSHEISQVKTLLGDITQLEQQMEKQHRYGMADLLSSLKDSLANVIDNRDLYKMLPGTASHVSNLMKEYGLEINYFVKFYKKLVEMEKAAKRENDQALLDKIQGQKRKVLQYIASYQGAAGDSLTTRLADVYQNEVKRSIEVLQELEKLEKKSALQNPEYLTEIEISRRDLLSNMDKRLLDLLGYRDYARMQGPTLSQLYQEWRRTRLAKFEAKYTEYLVMKKSLIQSADKKARNRMLQRDLGDALLNYADGDYYLAEMQLNKVIEDYGDYFSRFEAVYFYRAEALYAQLLYEQAYKAYQELLQKYPDTPHRDDVYLRLLTIAQTLGWKNEFKARYAEFLQFAPQVENKIRNRIYYLAGYYFLKLKDTKSAEEALAKIEKGSKYYFPGLYLTGLALANRHAYEGAVRIFSLLVNSNSLPWSDPKLALLKNHALLKLGYIYYDRGDYEKALAYLNRISLGAEERDKVLIGMAWAHMKNGDYDQAISNVHDLYQNFLSSNYTYEALVLAAHCKRLLNQPDDAMHDLRYVANARGVLDIADKYNEERKNLLLQMDELEKMEEKVLENQDRRLYDIIAQIKYELQQQLLNLGYEGGIGSTIVQEFDAERQSIYRQIQELDSIILAAKKAGNREVLKTAVNRRRRLVKALATYQADKSIDRVNYFLDYPLATRESSNKYRKQVLQEIIMDMEIE